MKNIIKSFGFIALVAVIGFSMAACGGGGGGGTAPTITSTATMVPGTVGVAYDQTLTATGDEATWSLESSTLPAGLNLASNGNITGTPTTAVAAKEFTVIAMNDTGYDSKVLYITIVAATPVITTASLPNGTVTVEYNQTLVATGVKPITWALDGGTTLPAGLTLSAAGVISGKPTVVTAGTPTPFTVKATNGKGSITKEFSITIAAAAPAITTATLPNGKLGEAYNQTLTATGTPTIKWTLDGGSTLPTGLSLAENGTISGTPTAAGTKTFTVKATNTAGSDTKELSIAIANETGLTVPAGITAVTTTATSITVSWDAVTGATSYIVYIWGNGWEQVGTPTTTSFVHTGLAQNTSYSYAVRAKNSIGEGPLSTVEVKAKTDAFGGGTSLTITNTAEWNAAISALNGKTGHYTLTINSPTTQIGVPGGGSLGTTAAGSELKVTLNGNGKLHLGGQGSIIRVGANQILIIDSENLTLQGLTNGVDGALHGNNNPVIYVDANGTLELNNGKIIGNTSSGQGGGVYIAANGKFTMEGGEISGNTASGSGGGGVHNRGTFSMNSGKITGNTSGSNAIGGSNGRGGGVYIISSGGFDARFTMGDGEISGNTTLGTGQGGGVYMSGDLFTMYGGEISGNSAGNTAQGYSNKGGGVYVDGGESMTRREGKSTGD
jgi:hypothetical protein